MKRKVITALFFIGFCILLYVFIEKPYSNRHFVTIHGETLAVDLAITDYVRQKGLMGRQFLGKNSGMLFIFPQSAHLTFWMKNTVLPLSIAFISDQGKITQIEKMQPDSYKGKPPEYTSQSKVRYALEVNQGWFEKNGVQVGDHVSFSRSIRRANVQ
ncbi:MAG: hypothetical protein A3B70_07500 [Deltaproteobacteria bacterium RIFCSPHIGHO2_02_FULL_40_11]|nr:MAG: hypothetical protein A3B70_07500 [Deltaproteobacteria bacterium RIFCSPHIGHO2_02_FULL_40_11]